MQVTLKMWTPKGTMVEVTGEYDAKDAQELTHHVVTVEADMLRHGFTSQRPDHTYPTKEQVIEGIVVVELNTPDGNGTQKALYLYTDHPKLEYAEYVVYPEDEWYPKLAASLNMGNAISGQPPRKGDMHKPANQKAWQQFGRKATFVPARNKEGQLIFRKDKEGNRKSWPEYRVQSVEGFSQASTNGNHAATNGAQGTRNAGATPNDTWEIKKLLEWGFDAGAFNAYNHARNRFFELVREELKAPQGGEYTALQAATDEVVANIKNLFISDAWNRINARADVSAQVGMDSEEGIPF